MKISNKSMLMTEKCEEFPVEARSRSYEGLSNLNQEVKKLTQNALGKHGFVQVELLSNWSNILGEELSYGIKPVSLSFPTKERSKGTLKVRTAGGAFALLFEHQKGQVIEKINTYFGYPAIQQIKIEQNGMRLNMPQQNQQNVWPLDEEEIEKLAQKVAHIEDNELRKKMLEIGIQLIQKGKK